MKTEIQLLIGLPCSGKMTWAKRQKKGYPVVKKDIRLEMKKENPNVTESEVFFEYVRRAQKAIESGNYDIVYLVAEHPSARNRRKFLRVLNEGNKGYNLTFRFFKTTRRQCIKRNKARADDDVYKTTEQAIRKMHRHLDKPTEEEITSLCKEFGYDKIKIIFQKTKTFKGDANK